MCGSTQYAARKYPKGKQEQKSAVSGNLPQNNTGRRANMVRSILEPTDFLYSLDSDDGNVCTVRVEDKGSKPCIAMVDVHGVPAKGIIDSGADITIINGDLFQRVVTVAHLKKSTFKKSDRILVTYDQEPFTLHGRMDLDITFNGKIMRTAVYIKMDSREQLLLSEGYVTN